ncbi:hypothetical protein TNCV_2685761 [Trichonephila clavipes]|nr:hypothetical protein TNCV_2685761 [Trichonephila clavipes]
MELLAYTFKDTRYFMHKCSSFGYLSNKVPIWVKWSRINKILHMSRLKESRIDNSGDRGGQGTGFPRMSHEIDDITTEKLC